MENTIASRSSPATASFCSNGAPTAISRANSSARKASTSTTKGRIWVADAANHRVQVFDGEGHLKFLWGRSGTAPGELSYPYGLKLDGQGHVYICEYGNSRIQKFTLDGRSLACWGSIGREPGQLYNPWGIARDSQGRIHIVDSMNNRVQRIRL